MDEALAEARHNLRKVGEFDLANALGSKSTTAGGTTRAVEYSRYLVAINGSRSASAARIRAEILAVLWGYADHRDDGECLRVHILMAIEMLVREHPDIESIHGELLALATAHEVSLVGGYDSRGLAQLIQRADFEGLKRALHGLCPSTKSYVQVFGRAHHYRNTGDMDGIAYDRVLRETSPYERRVLSRSRQPRGAAKN